MPVVVIRTPGGTELGVTTDEGVFFLGRTAQEGPAKVLYWLGDSPLVESGEVRRRGGSIYEVLLDVDLPAVPISFEPLRPGESLVLIGVDDDWAWQYGVVVPEDPMASGTIVRWPSGLRIEPSQVGAGVFRDTGEGLTLVGLVKATAEIEGGGRFLLLAGLPELRVALLEPRSAVPVREVLYRADGTRIIRTKR
jgi:hypothetical protein